ncbi:MAG: hypothetical protein SFU86_22785 [Pirellulaceae bacterium]|nr:hypothetical protein [Pirellulaceae bacterium]
MSVTPTTYIALPSHWPRFPVVVDSGFNSTFLISARQLEQWGGVSLRSLPKLPEGKTGAVLVRGQPAKLLDAFLWLHPNLPGHRDVRVNASPFTIYANPGIIVTPPGRELTRFPLLGTLALESNALALALDPLPVASAPGEFKLHLTIRSML